MTSPLATKARPLSPHLSIYKPQLTMGLSIFHRITGTALAFGLPFFVAWLVALADGPNAYARFVHAANSLIGQLLLIGWSFSFFFHFCMGIRHLFWDMGLFLDIKQAYRTGYFGLSIAVLLTAGFWLCYYGCDR